MALPPMWLGGERGGEIVLRGPGSRSRGLQRHAPIIDAAKAAHFISLVILHTGDPGTA